MQPEEIKVGYHYEHFTFGKVTVLENKNGAWLCEKFGGHSSRADYLPKLPAGSQVLALGSERFLHEL
jgi:hypothetical protein